MTRKQMKRCSTWNGLPFPSPSVIIRDIQIKFTVRYNLRVEVHHLILKYLLGIEVLNLWERQTYKYIFLTFEKQIGDAMGQKEASFLF